MKTFCILLILNQLFWVVEGERGCITTIVTVDDPCVSNPCYNQGTCFSFGSGEGGERKRRGIYGGGMYGGGMSGGGGQGGSGPLDGLGGPRDNGGGEGGRGVGFYCRCRPGYTGRYCQIVDPCDSNPCYNQGTCVSFGIGEGGGRKRRQLPGGLGPLGGLGGLREGGGGEGGRGVGFYCRCRPGFTGRHCQTSNGEISCNPTCEQNELCTDSGSGIGVCTPRYS